MVSFLAGLALMKTTALKSKRTLSYFRLDTLVRHGATLHHYLCPKSCEEEKGPGFSRLGYYVLIAVEFQGPRILLTYFRPFVTYNFDIKCYTVRRFIIAANGVPKN